MNWENEKKITQLSSLVLPEKLDSSTKSILLVLPGEERIYADVDLGHAVIFGRDSGSDIVIDTQFTSRKHLVLCFHRGKFVIVDKSTNGTYVQFAGQDEIYIRREELALMGEGAICLGESINHCEDAVIRFSV